MSLDTNNNSRGFHVLPARELSPVDFSAISPFSSNNNIISASRGTKQGDDRGIETRLDTSTHTVINMAKDEEVLPQPASNQDNQDEEIGTWDSSIEELNSTSAEKVKKVDNNEAPLQPLNNATIEFEASGRDKLIEALTDVNISEIEYSDGEISVLSDEAEQLLEIDPLRA
jgi:hypothetical protein